MGTIKISIIDKGVVKELIDLLNSEFNNLPLNIQGKLSEISKKNNENKSKGIG